MFLSKARIYFGSVISLDNLRYLISRLLLLFFCILLVCHAKLLFVCAILKTLSTKSEGTLVFCLL